MIIDDRGRTQVQAAASTDLGKKLCQWSIYQELEHDLAPICSEELPSKLSKFFVPCLLTTLVNLHFVANAF